jgi:phenylpyruvate tautomerase PptA (4-oxalocrotonate tautomerase family)
VEQKKALFARIASLLAESPGLRTEDVFVNLIEVAKKLVTWARAGSICLAIRGASRLS